MTSVLGWLKIGALRKTRVTFDILTVLPDAFEPYISLSVLGRAREKGIIKINLVNLREFAADKRGTVDDAPYGGGPGMVLKAEPIYRAVKKIELRIKNKELRVRKILFSTRGKKFNQAAARRLAGYDRLILVCGRYEGVDERVAKHIADEEISIGDFVLAGGELPALIVLESVARQVPGVLGKYESLEEEKGSYPVYTRPEVFTIDGRRRRVPKALVSGNHREIEAWRLKKSGSAE